MKRLTQPKDCCHSTVREDATSVFCMECGNPLARCMAFQECGGLVGEDGRCEVCVDPHLQIIPGTAMNAPVGGSVALPFDLVNNSTIDRPLFITGLWSRERGEWREERLGWEKLDSGARAAGSVTARELDSAGSHEIEVMWAVSTRWRTREEKFAFSTRVLLHIADDKDSHGTTIQISSENQMNGNVIQIQQPEKRPGDDGLLVEALDMHIQRLDLEERRQRLRGMTDGARVTRACTFEFRGFAEGQTPPSGLPIVTPDGILVFGRSDTRSNQGDCDVRILAYGPDGVIDEQQSLTISRRHFDLSIENDRLLLRVTGSHGLRVNGNAYGPDKIVQLGDGDSIAPLVKLTELLTLKIAFRRELDMVSTIVITRTPQVPENSQ